MKNELTILNALKTVIQTQLSGYLTDNLASIGERNVAIDFPDTDQMPMKTMLYIQPNWTNYENLSTESDLSTFGIALFIVCKKDTQENLTRKIYGYFNALYSLLRTNISLKKTGCISMESLIPTPESGIFISLIWFRTTCRVLRMVRFTMSLVH